MARIQKPSKPKARRKRLTVSYRARLIDELRSDPKLSVEYLNAAAEEADPRVYLAALRTVAEAQGMAKVASAAGVPRESLYRALSEDGNPRFDTLHAILRAAGFTLAVKQASHGHYGIRPFPKGGTAAVTNELVNKLREGDAY